MNAGQPLILGVNEAEFGRLAGKLTFFHEIVVMLCIAPIGALSDKIGRRPLYMAAFVLMGIGHFLYPLAETEDQLLLYRMVLALGTASASAMLATVANDYPVENSRAKMIAATMLFNEIGMVMLTSVFKSLPEWFEDSGYDTRTAVTYTRWVAAGCCMMIAAVVIVGLKKGAPAQSAEREPFLATMWVGVTQARKPRIMLCYLAAVVSRGDMAVLSTFLTMCRASVLLCWLARATSPS